MEENIPFQVNEYHKVKHIFLHSFVFEKLSLVRCSSNLVLVFERAKYWKFLYFLGVFYLNYVAIHKVLILWFYKSTINLEIDLWGILRLMRVVCNVVIWNTQITNLGWKGKGATFEWEKEDVFGVKNIYFEDIQWWIDLVDIRVHRAWGHIQVCTHPGSGESGGEWP